VPLRRKLLLAMALPALLLGMVGAIGLLSLRHLEQAAGRILADNYRSIQEARRMSRTLRLLETPGNAREESVAGFEEALARCEGNITVPGAAEVLAGIRAAWETLRPDLGGRADAAVPALRDPRLGSLHTAIEELVALNEQAMIAFERKTRRVARGMFGAVALSVLAAFAGLALFTAVSASRIARLQNRLAFVMNEVLEGLVLMDAQHRILAANRVGRALLGLPAGGGAPDPREDVKALLAAAGDETGRPERDLGELRFELDGSERVFRPRVLAVPSLGRGHEGRLILFWDVTEQRRFEESRRRFISMLSHQLKTPMTSLTMSVNLIREKLRGPEHAELLAIAAESCQSLSALISDLVDAARGVAPDLTLNLRRMDLARLLRSALRPIASQAAEKGIELVVPPEGRPLLAAVDPVKFPWVVTNIAGNALRNTSRGGRIVVAAAAIPGGIEVTVADTGSGIAPENLERIFQPYVSLDPAPRPGTHGLGLAIAREIVQAHGGTIDASSEPGRGTRFIIRIPV